MKAKIYNQEGKEIGEQELDSAIFGVKAKSEVIHQVVTAYMANSRQASAHAKRKGEVRGGGKKPWKQKGTGSARAGSSRSPLWRGGGVIFGPNEEINFKQKINKKVKRKALLMCLSEKVANNKLILIDKIELPEMKTKKIVELLNKLPNKAEKTLIAVEKDNKKVMRSTNNLPFAKAVFADNLNIMDIMNYKYMLLPLKGLELLKKTYNK